MRSECQRLCIGFFALLVFCYAHPRAAARIKPEELAALRQVLPSLRVGEGSVMTAPDLASRETIDAFVLSDHGLAKTDRLYRKLTQELFVESLGKAGVVILVKFIEYLRGAEVDALKEACGLYVQTGRGSYLGFAVEFTSDGEVYIHLESRDRNKDHGSFKHFSRSIAYDSEKVVAHLRVRVPTKFLDSPLDYELRALQRLYDNPGVARVEHAGYFWQKHGATVRLTVSLVTTLYESDLARYRYLFKRSRRTLPLAKTLEVFKKAALSLQALHKAGVIHRDIKLENLLIREGSQGTEVVVTDFGFVDFPETSECRPGMRGCPGHIAPDQCLRLCSHAFGFATQEDGQKGDTFALGVSFYSFLAVEPARFQKVLEDLNDHLLEEKKPALAGIEAQVATVQARLGQQEQLSSLTAYYEGGRDVDVKQDLYKLLFHMMAGQLAKRTTLDQVVTTLSRLEERLGARQGSCAVM